MRCSYDPPLRTSPQKTLPAQPVPHRCVSAGGRQEPVAEYFPQPIKHIPMCQGQKEAINSKNHQFIGTSHRGKATRIHTIADGPGSPIYLVPSFPVRASCIHASGRQHLPFDRLVLFKTKKAATLRCPKLSAWRFRLLQLYGASGAARTPDQLITKPIAAQWFEGVFREKSAGQETSSAYRSRIISRNVGLVFMVTMLEIDTVGMNVFPCTAAKGAPHLATTRDRAYNENWK